MTHRTQENLILIITVLLEQKDSNQDQQEGEMQRVRSGTVPDVKLPLLSPGSSGTYSPNTVLCDKTDYYQPGKFIQASVCPEFLLALHYKWLAQFVSVSANPPPPPFPGGWADNPMFALLGRTSPKLSHLLVSATSHSVRGPPWTGKALLSLRGNSKGIETTSHNSETKTSQII